eukprot:4475841-Karenia_brevis.AAC.1
MADPGVYAKFIRQLRPRGMVHFKIAYDEEGVLGTFFVAKKSGGLRIIFGTRLLNCSFKDPPSTAPPSAAAFSNIETDKDR